MLFGGPIFASWLSFVKYSCMFFLAPLQFLYVTSVTLWLGQFFRVLRSAALKVVFVGPLALPPVWICSILRYFLLQVSYVLSRIESVGIQYSLPLLASSELRAALVGAGTYFSQSMGTEFDTLYSSIATVLGELSSILNLRI